MIGTCRLLYENICNLGQPASRPTAWKRAISRHTRKPPDWCVEIARGDCQNRVEVCEPFFWAPFVISSTTAGEICLFLARAGSARNKCYGTRMRRASPALPAGLCGLVLSASKSSHLVRAVPVAGRSLEHSGYSDRCFGNFMSFGVKRHHLRTITPAYRAAKNRWAGTHKPFSRGSLVLNTTLLYLRIPEAAPLTSRSGR